jgi:hypothetical protein
MKPNDCCILNSGGGSWAFAPLARQLSDALWVDVSETPRRFNYLLLADDAVAEARDDFFIPFASMGCRRLGRCFWNRCRVPSGCSPLSRTGSGA